MNHTVARKGTILKFESPSTSLQERLQEDAYPLNTKAPVPSVREGPRGTKATRTSWLSMGPRHVLAVLSGSLLRCLRRDMATDSVSEV